MGRKVKNDARSKDMHNPSVKSQNTETSSSIKELEKALYDMLEMIQNVYKDESSGGQGLALGGGVEENYTRKAKSSSEFNVRVSSIFGKRDCKWLVVKGHDDTVLSSAYPLVLYVEKNDGSIQKPSKRGFNCSATSLLGTLTAMGYDTRTLTPSAIVKLVELNGGVYIPPKQNGMPRLVVARPSSEEVLEFMNSDYAKRNQIKVLLK